VRKGRGRAIKYRPLTALSKVYEKSPASNFIP